MAVQNTRNQGHRAGEGGSCREPGKGGLELTPRGCAGSGGAGRGHGGFLFAASSSEALCRGRTACPSAISFPRLWPGVLTVLRQCPQPSHPAPAHKVRAILGRGPQSSPPIRLTSTTSSSLPWPSPPGLDLPQASHLQGKGQGLSHAEAQPLDPNSARLSSASPQTSVPGGTYLPLEEGRPPTELLRRLP